MARLAHQPDSRPRRPGIAHKPLAAATLIACCVLPVGCSSSPPATGGRFVEYPAQLDLRTALAAAESSLRARGYVIDRVAATDDAGEIIARPPGEQDRGWFSTALVVRARRDIGGSVRLTVARWPSQREDHEANTALRAIVETLGVQPVAGGEPGEPAR